jgi:single-stranded-DNA-specific exonuclease
MQTVWTVLPYQSGKINKLRKAHEISPLTAQLLINRGIENPEAAEKYLHPKLTDLHDPNLLHDMEKAVRRIDRAIDQKEPILIYADYDCDGLGGSSILFNVLKKIGADVRIHIPNRNRDGYGIRIDRLEKAKKEGIKVVITVDNGITAVEPAEFCRNHGMDLIVTDHHEFRMEGDKIRLPQAFALIHPRIPGSNYPTENPCGTAVAFKLAWAIGRHRSGGDRPAPELRQILLESLGTVALGSVADVVDLVDESRVLVKYGLQRLEKQPTEGFGALIDVAKVEFPVDSTQIGFKIAPRINAASRMGSADRAFNLLTTEDRDEAYRIARTLDEENQRRRAATRSLTEQAFADVRRVYGDIDELIPPGIVIALEKCHVGLVGIVAAKLVEAFKRPSLVVTLVETPEGPKIKGSGRTIHGISLLGALNRCQPHLENYGGHAMACGLAIKPGKLEDFRADWGIACGMEAQNVKVGFNELKIDAKIDLDHVGYDLVREINLLEPCGAGNRPALLMTTGFFDADSLKAMGDKEAGHCSFMIRDGDTSFRVVSFSNLARFRELENCRDQKIQLAFRPRINRFGGRTSVQLECEDLKLVA